MRGASERHTKGFQSSERNQFVPNLDQFQAVANQAADSIGYDALASRAHLSVGRQYANRRSPLS
jgi:hypothetical protein